MASSLPPKRSRGAARIVQTAEALFSERGYDAVSVSDIAAGAGISKSTVFHHFETKEELYFAVMRHSATRFAAVLDELEQQPAGTVEQIRRFAQAHMQCILENEASVRLALRDMLSDATDRSRAMGERVFAGNFERIVATIRGAQEAGHLRPEVHPAMVALLLIASDVFFFQARAVISALPHVDFADTPERYSEMMADIILRGALARADS